MITVLYRQENNKRLIKKLLPHITSFRQKIRQETIRKRILKTLIKNFPWPQSKVLLYNVVFMT